MGNKATKTVLTVDDIKMLEKTTDLKRDQIEKWFNDFKKECKSGELDKKNFIRFYKELMPNHTNADKFCEFVFKAFDKDHSGSIDFTEFLLSFSISARGNVEDKLNWAFSMYDLDNNDYIDEKEMKKVLKAIYSFMDVNTNDTVSPDVRANKIFKEIDTNEDRRISRQEFIKGCMNDEFLRHLLAPNL